MIKIRWIMGRNMHIEKMSMSTSLALKLEIHSNYIP